MKERINPIEQVIDEFASHFGFRKDKKAWYRINDDTVWFVGLQKSDWGDQY